MRFSKTLLAAGMAVAMAAPLSAQMAMGMPESYRTVQMHALQRQRATLLAMADSMPERLYRDKVTPIQRDFAQQVAHVAFAMAYIVPMTMGVPAPAPFDSSTYLNSRAGLKNYVNGVYDWAEGVLRNQTAADREASINLMGTPMPRWQVWDELHQHTFWTAGQIVANFRKNGMAPPGFGFF